ncbi:hypothetical protein D3C71_1945130 [compost metagenome]
MILSGYGVLSANNYYEMQIRRNGAAPPVVPGVAAGRNAGGPASASSTTADVYPEGVAAYQMYGYVNTGTAALAMRYKCSTFI